MSVRIRLSRHGAKKKPFYRIVVCDQRFPRDGRYIEQVGTYDPNASAEADQTEPRKGRYLDQAWRQTHTDRFGADGAPEESKLISG